MGNLRTCALEDFRPLDDNNTQGSSMTEHTSHIKNPLTVISIFAAIAETSGTIVLPFVADAHQGTFIWFLMLFPTFLVLAFFLTLNLNHKTLYAPSDYQNQNHFLNLFGIATQDERETKLTAELLESAPIDAPTTLEECASREQEPVAATADAEQQNETVPTDTTTPTGDIQDNAHGSTQTPMEMDDTNEPLTEFDLKEYSNQAKSELRKRLRNIEKRAIHKLKEVTGIAFSENVKIDIPGTVSPLIFDAVAHANETLHIAEIKYFENTSFAISRFNGTFSSANIVAQSISQLTDRKLMLHLVVVLNQDYSNTTTHNINTALGNVAKRLGLRAKVYVISQEALYRNGVPGSWIFNQ